MFYWVSFCFPIHSTHNHYNMLCCTGFPSLTAACKAVRIPIVSQLSPAMHMTLVNNKTCHWHNCSLKAATSVCYVSDVQVSERCCCHCTAPYTHCVGRIKNERKNDAYVHTHTADCGVTTKLYYHDDVIFFWKQPASCTAIKKQMFSFRKDQS